MATETVNISAGATSDPIEVTPNSIVGFDTDKPIEIISADGASVARLTNEEYAPVICPPVFSIRSEGEAVVVKVHTAD